MIGAFHDPHEKLIRARWHLDCLDRSMEEFMATHPRRLVGAVEDGKYRLRYQVVAEPPPGWGTVIGDCVHNLRSCLDHLVYQLTLTNLGEVLDDTSFPILETEEAFDEKSHRDFSRGTWPIRGIQPDAQVAVEKLQPYHRKEGPHMDPLWLLNRLWNIDKHRLLHLAVIHPSGIGVSSSYQLSDKPQSHSEIFTSGPWSDGDIVLEVDMPAGEEPPFDPFIECQLVFDDSRSSEIIGPVVGTLTVLCDYVDKWVLPQFLPFLA
jgi:hypothetical protein